MKKVLVVDDYEVLLKLVCDRLAFYGYRAFAARGGREALELLARESIDIVLLDVQMPVISGTDVLEAIRADPHYGCLPVVALTACVMKGDRERFMKEGFDGYSSKPIDFPALLSLISRLTLKARTLNRAIRSSSHI